MVLHMIIALIAASGDDVSSAESGRCPPVLAGWITPADGLPEHRVVLSVRVRGREVLWNNRKVSRSALRIFLARSRAMEPTAFVTFDPAGAADCATATAIRDLIDASARCGEELFCGQGGRREWASLFRERKVAADATRRDPAAHISALGRQP